MADRYVPTEAAKKARELFRQAQPNVIELGAEGRPLQLEYMPTSKKSVPEAFSTLGDMATNPVRAKDIEMPKLD